MTATMSERDYCVRKQTSKNTGVSYPDTPVLNRVVGFLRQAYWQRKRPLSFSIRQ